VESAATLPALLQHLIADWEFLMDKLSDALTERQKYNKVSNLLTKLRRKGMIVNTGSDAAPCWRLAES
jgi:ATP-dependent DNA helicase RecG